MSYSRKENVYMTGAASPVVRTVTATRTGPPTIPVEPAHIPVRAIGNKVIEVGQPETRYWRQAPILVKELPREVEIEDYEGEEDVTIESDEGDEYILPIRETAHVKYVKSHMHPSYRHTVSRPVVEEHVEVHHPVTTSVYHSAPSTQVTHVYSHAASTPYRTVYSQPTYVRSSPPPTRRVTRQYY